MYPNPAKRGNVVTSKYGTVRKDWYGWSEYLQERAQFISDNIRESSFLYSCGTFDALDEGDYDSEGSLDGLEGRTAGRKNKRA